MLNAPLQDSSRPVAIGAVGDVRLGVTALLLSVRCAMVSLAIYLLGEDAATAMLADIWEVMLHVLHVFWK